MSDKETVEGEANGAETIGIVGLGLIGGSIGLALRDPSRELIGFDVSPKAQDIAISRFCVDRVAPLEEVARCRVVFVAVPPRAVVAISEAVVAAKAESTVITDCSSVKAEVATWAESLKLATYVPGHPMAGHEKGGAEYSSAWMFRAARWILTPSRHTSRSALADVERLVKGMGATPIRLDSSVHDRHVAMLSHLPHAIAAVLVLMGGELEHIEVGAGSWRDVTRVGGVDPELWSQILGGNRAELVAVLKEFEDKIKSLRDVLNEDDLSALRKVLVGAQSAKREQDKHISAGETKTFVKRKGRR